MLLDGIRAIVDPPSGPDDFATRIDGDGISLGLPSDFLALMAIYGPGMFGEDIALCSPQNPHPAFDIVRRTRGNVEVSQEILNYWQGEVRWPPYRWWPEDGCVVQWANWEHHSFHWLTEGAPDDWPVIVMRDNEQLHRRLEMTTVEVLAAVRAGPKPVDFLGDRPDQPIIFTPSSRFLSHLVDGTDG